MADKAALTTCPWPETEAEQAADFYVSIFPGSRLDRVYRHAEAGPCPVGSSTLAGFGLNGHELIALFSDMVNDPDQSRVGRVMRATSTMSKFDTAALEKAYADSEMRHGAGR